jgi:hypothetical protein
MFTRSIKKLLGGVLFLIVLFGLSRAFIYYSAWRAESEASDLLQEACMNLRKLSDKPLPTCESELTAESKGLGGYYPRKLRCLRGLSNLEGYKACSNLGNLETFPE